MAKRRKEKFNTFRDGRIHVMERMCDTCIFRPDTELPEARDRMVREATARDTAIICHDTLTDRRDNAICRGFYEKHPTPPLVLARAMNALAFDAVKSHETPTGRQNQKTTKEGKMKP